MARRKIRFPKPPCECQVDSYCRYVVRGESKATYNPLTRALGVDPEQVETLIYDPELKTWFTLEEYAMPIDGDLICTECEKPINAIPIQDPGEIDNVRRSEGLSNPYEWYLRWMA
jgi:hypothetical protein